MKVTVNPVADISELLEWRAEVIEKVFGIFPTLAMMEANRSYYSRHLADGTHIAVVAEADGIQAGCGAICITEELPSPENLSGLCAYLMNIYVREAYRGHGIGHSVVCWLVGKARELGCDKIYLETTDTARSLYRSIGFDELPDMMRYADIFNSQP